MNAEEKIWPNFQRIIELFTQKIVTKLSKIWVWDLGSEIQDPEKTYFQIPESKRHRIPDPQHCLWVTFALLDPDFNSLSGSSNMIESGYNPDPKHR